MIREEIVHINGIPKKLVVFLHGYLDSADHADSQIAILSDMLPDIALHIPQSPIACEVGHNMRQWYSVYRFDPRYERKNASSMPEFLAYYNHMVPALNEASGLLRPYLEQTLLEYGMDYQDLFLCGFSQGAMLAIHTGLMLPEPPAGIISFSGLVAGSDFLQKHACAYPDVLLIHGTDDQCLRYPLLDFSARKLAQIGCCAESRTIVGGEHKITPEAVAMAAEFIRRRLK